MRYQLIVVAAALFPIACSLREAPPPPARGPIGAPAGGAAGYQHGSEGSKFVLGGATSRIAEHGYSKLVGPQGTLAVDLRNGSVFARPRSTADALARAPFGGSPAAHDRFVQDYFAGLGLPRDQVLAIRGMTMLDGSGRSADAVKPKLRLTAYYSVVQRTVAGVAVPDSFAWARVNVDGAVVEEGVYWPALPAAAVAGARDMAVVLADPRRRAPLDAQVPAGSDAAVAIRHTSATTDQPFRAFASYDVVIRPGQVGLPSPAGGRPTTAGMTYTRHLDASGHDLRLPQEEVGAFTRPQSKSGG
jgi:hypothetical protein